MTDLEHLGRVEHTPRDNSLRPPLLRFCLFTQKRTEWRVYFVFTFGKYSYENGGTVNFAYRINWEPEPLEAVAMVMSPEAVSVGMNWNECIVVVLSLVRNTRPTVVVM